MLCVVPLRLPVLKLKKVPRVATPVLPAKDTSGIDSLISSFVKPHSDTSVDFCVTGKRGKILHLWAHPQVILLSF